MSDVTYADDAAEAEDLVIDDRVEEEVEEDLEEPAEKPAKDWEKLAHDREGALAKERSRRRAEQQRSRDLEDRLNKLETSKKEPTDAELLKLAESLREDDEDPITDIAALKRFAKQYAAEQRAAAERDHETEGQRRAVQQIANRMLEAEADFSEDNADYPEAAKFLRTQRQEEFEDLGYSGNQLQRELSNDLIGIVQRALQAGKDPAEAVYNLAKKRGFGVDGVTKKLQTIASGQRAARGLGASPGNRGSAPLSVEAVNKLSGAAFDAGFEKLRKQSRRA